MNEKLLNYGFSQDQIKELLKKKSLKTIHGKYEIFEGNVYLHKKDIIKLVIELE